MSERKPRVLVALSGGMDSAATVLFLREAGYEPCALFLDMLDDPAERERAIRTAEWLEVPLRVEPVADLFRETIIQYVLDAHSRGLTPAPCSRCNPLIKWKLLAEHADRSGIRYLSTGHYVRVVRRQDGTGKSISFFARGIDPAKDQSYYLWAVPSPIIERAVMPLGTMTKAEVREKLALTYGLRQISERKESMGVCFLKGQPYGQFLQENLSPSVLRPGCVVDTTGQTVGTHLGTPLYTIGQKKGYTCSSSGCSVIGIDVTRNQIVVGPPERLLSRHLVLNQWQANSVDLLREQEELTVMVRGIGRNPRGKCRVEIRDGERMDIFLSEDNAWAAAPGQPAAIYSGDLVVGGGILEAATP